MESALKNFQDIEVDTETYSFKGQLNIRSIV